METYLVVAKKFYFPTPPHQPTPYLDIQIWSDVKKNTTTFLLKNLGKSFFKEEGQEKKSKKTKKTKRMQETK